MRGLTQEATGLNTQLYFRPGEIHGGPSLTPVAAAALFEGLGFRLLLVSISQGIPTFGRTDPLGPHAPRVHIISKPFCAIHLGVPNYMSSALLFYFIFGLERVLPPSRYGK